MPSTIEVRDDPAGLKGLEPSLVQAELERIRRAAGGVLLPRNVWESSIAEDHPLHSAFTWDDSKAAVLYRDEEARNLIRHVEIVGESGKKVRAWHHVVVDSVSGYMPVQEIAVSEVLRAQVLGEIRAGIVSARKRLAEFQEFRAQVKKLDDVIDALG